MKLTMMLTVRRAVFTAVALSCLLAIVPARAQQPPADAAVPVGTIDVTGATRFKTEQVVQVSGLTIGSKVKVAELQAAAKRLTETGMFSDVSYRYSVVEGRFNITFEIEEAKWTMPVVFDFNNAVAQAFSRDDLAPFLRQKGFRMSPIEVRPG